MLVLLLRNNKRNVGLNNRLNPRMNDFKIK